MHVVELIFHLAIWIALFSSLKSAETVEICRFDVTPISCQDNEVILVHAAKYGRMRVGRCVNRDYGYVGCEADVTHELDSWCSGRKQCMVDEGIYPLLDTSASPCPEDLKVYLEVTFDCLEVAVPLTSNYCEGQNAPSNILGGKGGVIASHMTDVTGCGSSDAPWVIVGPDSTTIALTILDFGTSRDTSDINCPRIYGKIIEEEIGVSQNICGGHLRERLLYQSMTNIVEIQINSQPNEPGFIIKYTISPRKSRSAATKIHLDLTLVLLLAAMTVYV